MATGVDTTAKPGVEATAKTTSLPDTVQRHRVVIVGGGFGGLYLAKSLKRAEVSTSRWWTGWNFHLFQPLLYQVATGGLSPGEIMRRRCESC